MFNCSTLPISGTTATNPATFADLNNSIDTLSATHTVQPITNRKRKWSAASFNKAKGPISQITNKKSATTGGATKRCQVRECATKRCHVRDSATIMPQEVEFAAADFQVGDFVIVAYEAEHYPGKIIRIPDSQHVTVKCLTKVFVVGSVWKWPRRDDIADYDLSEVVGKIGAPSLLPGSGRKIEFYVQELDHS